MEQSKIPGVKNMLGTHCSHQNLLPVLVFFICIALLIVLLVMYY